MNSLTLNFTATGRLLVNNSKCLMPSNTVNYIEAQFELDEEWQAFDSVRAVWSSNNAIISTVLDENGKVAVPSEVLAEMGNVLVNLAGSNVNGETLTERLTTFPVLALRVTAEALVTGSETAELTPSQFEQYVAQVRGYISQLEETIAGLEQLVHSNTLQFTDDGNGNVTITRGE